MKPLRIQDVDIHAGTFGSLEKRVKKNRENLAKFFSETDKYGNPRINALEKIDNHTFLQLARAYSSHQNEFEHVFAYCRRYKQAALEITEEDLLETKQHVIVKTVTES